MSRRTRFDSVVGSPHNLRRFVGQGSHTCDANSQIPAPLLCASSSNLLQFRPIICFLLPCLVRPLRELPLLALLARLAPSSPFPRPPYAGSFAHYRCPTIQPSLSIASARQSASQPLTHSNAFEGWRTTRRVSPCCCNVCHRPHGRPFSTGRLRFA